ncbi:hypothetical protein DESC_820031 [Desulfosarcina cetonica]|nr:hypothetical protein DESC_820031 [Desulfosarcina cetonica]
MRRFVGSASPPQEAGDIVSDSPLDPTTRLGPSFPAGFLFLRQRPLNHLERSHLIASRGLVTGGSFFRGATRFV